MSESSVSGSAVLLAISKVLVGSKNDCFQTAEIIIAFNSKFCIYVFKK